MKATPSYQDVPANTGRDCRTSDTMSTSFMRSCASER